MAFPSQIQAANNEVVKLIAKLNSANRSDRSAIEGDIAKARAKRDDLYGKYVASHNGSRTSYQTMSEILGGNPA